MFKNKWGNVVGSLVVFVGLAAMPACTHMQEMLRSDLKFVGDAKQTQDGLTMEARSVTDKNWAALGLVKSAVFAELSGKQEYHNILLLDPPIFAVRVTNTTGHVVKMNGIIIKLIDSAGNLYDAVRKDGLGAALDNDLAAMAQSGLTPTPEARQQLLASLAPIKVLDDNVQLLPDYSETFLISFTLPMDRRDPNWLNAWFAQQTTLRLKIFEVPTKVDQAGAVSKRVAFEFPTQVLTVRDTYEVGFASVTLVKTEPVTK